LWVAVVAAILSLLVAIRGEWQTAVREQTRISAEQAVQKARQETLVTVLDISAEADQLAYKQIDQAEYEAWKSQADGLWNSAQQRLKPLLPPVEFAGVFAPTNPSPIVLSRAANNDHNDYVLRLTELATRLRNLALKYA